MKTDLVGAQQSFYLFPLPRANAKSFRIRPRDLPENRHASVGPLLLDQTGEQRKVIILHQHGGMFHISHFLQHRVGELDVNFPIGIPIPRRETPGEYTQCGRAAKALRSRSRSNSVLPAAV